MIFFSITNVLLLLLLSISINHATLLWRINVEPPAYLLGTIHIPYPMIWPWISDTAKEIFQNSTHFYPEVDMTNFFTSTQLRMCARPHVQPVQMNHPAQPILPAPFLDLYLMIEARRTKKTVISLESVEIYCEFAKVQSQWLRLPNMTTGLFGPMATPGSDGKNPFETIKHFYNCDLNERGEFLPQPSLPVIDPDLIEQQKSLEEIVARRDTEMAKKINETLHNASRNDRLFFAVGFLHLMNPHGLVGKLKHDYQYSVTRLCSDPAPFRTDQKCEGPSWCDFHAE